MKNLPKALWRNSLYLQIINVNPTLSKMLEILGHSLKLKIMPNTTIAVLTKVISRVVRTVSVNPWEMLF